MNEGLIRNEVVIDWKHIYTSVVKKWWIILLCMIIGGGCGLGLGIRADKPVYECKANYVLSYSGGDSVNQMSSEYSFLSRILFNCTEVLSQNTFADIIAEEVNGSTPEDSDDYISGDVISELITYSYDTHGTLIYVTVDTPNADLSYSIINSIIEHLPDYIKDQYKLAGISSMVFSLINTPEKPEEPVKSTTRIMFTAIGIVAFAFICIAVIVFKALLDTRIKKEEDLKNHFNVPVLGVIPNFYAPEFYKGGYYKYGSNK